MRLFLLFILLFSFSVCASVKPKKLNEQYRKFKKATKCRFIITSARRSLADNKRVKGSKNSFHLVGMAYDIVPLTGCNKTYYELAIIAKNYFNGVILYKDHIHVDVGNRIYYNLGEQNG